MDYCKSDARRHKNELQNWKVDDNHDGISGFVASWMMLHLIHFGALVKLVSLFVDDHHCLRMDALRPRHQGARETLTNSVGLRL